ncbi:MAG: hypothetical protein Q8M54_00310 [Desulfobaccales bacterium]|nr:hypothetical protein [Desulfobaccales bacterium]
MIKFRFTVNESFRSYSTHAITVPKGQVDYRKLSEAGLDSGNLTILFPRGEKIRGHMNYGQAGYGPYYQIRTYPEESIPAYLAPGNKVFVILLKDGPKKYAVLEYRD